MQRKFSSAQFLGILLAACIAAIPVAAQSNSRPATTIASSAASPATAPEYDLLLKGGHVIDPKNNIDDIFDIAIKDGKIAKVAKGISATSAIKAVSVTGLYVTPGLIDMHTHVFWGVTPKDYDDGEWSLQPDVFALNNGVTTIVDAGTSGWRNFPEFKKRVIDTSTTRVLAMLNIVGAGMGSGPIEQNVADMDGKKTGEMALQYPGIIVGVKSAHFTGPEWTPYQQAEIAGTMAHIPVMIDYGSRRIERPLYQLLETVLRPGDIYTHMYMGGRGEQDSQTGGPGKGMWEGRQRGVYFDVGHGGASFFFSVAVPLIKAGFIPDSISTDIHSDNVNAGLKDMLTTMDKFLAMGLTLQQVIADSTWHPAREVQQTQLGNLSVGSVADIAVLGMRTGDFGFTDGGGGVLHGSKKLECELTVKDGKFVYDLNGRAGETWYMPPSAADRQASKWTSLRMSGFGGTPRPIGANGQGNFTRPANANGRGWNCRWRAASGALDGVYNGRER